MAIMENDDNSFSYLVIIFLFSFPNYIIFCSHVLTVLMTYWMTLIGIVLANNYCDIANHIYYDYFHRYDPHNLLYVEIVKKF